LANPVEKHVFCDTFTTVIPTGSISAPILPGFVDSPMTRSFNKNFLWAQPETIARGIVHAVDKGRACVYVPGYWRYIMGVIKLIPERLFKHLRL
jgi:decaprenylphospho-beta-D-erythro-pentofuranosid-2-ulose 2-reductase